MMVKNRVLSALALLALTCSVSVNIAEASNLDTYRNLLKKGTYTIRFKDITPEERITNKDSIKMYGKNDMDRSQSPFLLLEQTSGMITSDGDRRYEELGAGTVKQCRLQKGEDTYVFLKNETVKDNNPLKEIFGGGKKNEVVPIRTNYLAKLMLGESYGSTALTRYLNAIIPNSEKSGDLPSFRYVTSGWLDNGLNYEDYCAEEDGVKEVVRYYFNGYALCKIAALRYWRNDSGVMEGKKAIVRIDEFSPNPTVENLELPPGVKAKPAKKK